MFVDDEHFSIPSEPRFYCQECGANGHVEGIIYKDKHVQMVSAYFCPNCGARVTANRKPENEKPENEKPREIE